MNHSSSNSNWENDNEPMQVVFDHTPGGEPNSIGQKINGRLLLLVAAILALLAAIWGGLLRVGWQFLPVVNILPALHAPLMITGFLGTLISLQRAVTLQKRWAYAAPILNLLGTLMLVVNLEYHFGILVATLGSIALLVIFGVILNRHPALSTGTLALGVALWVIGNLFWLGDGPVYHVVHWWVGYIILTIVGERLELSRLQRLAQRASLLYAMALGIFMLGLAIDTAESLASAGSDWGERFLGLGMVALAAWLARYDIARRTVRLPGLTRYGALGLLAGCMWLAVGGILRVVYGGVSGGFYYDAILHAVLLGFVMSVIFGHAPIIIPAVLNRPFNYRPILYAPLLLLQLSLALRIAGDVLLSMPIRQGGALLNALALVLFLFTAVLAIRSSARAAR